MSTDWQRKWEEGNIGFHQTKFHPMLEKYASKFKRGIILVPLCGKSLDMIYLASLGHSVIGVELSPIACRDFFKENKISVTESKLEDFVIFESTKITIWCGDFFKLPQRVWNQCTGIYDRAALIALPEQMRVQYCAEISKKSIEGIEILLITIEYPHGAIEGPPFSVSKEEVNKNFEKFRVQKLNSETISTLSISPTESVYWIH